jgi:predicted ATP-grasp superfamily ATP-dependent carboligase
VPDNNDLWSEASVKQTQSRFDATPVAIFDNYWGTTLAFARSLGQQGVPLYFYGSGAGRWSRYRTRRLRCPPIDNVREFQPWLREKVRSGEITRIAPTTDLIAYYASSLRDEFPADVQRTIAPLSEIEACLIKTRFAVASAIPGTPILPTLAADCLESALAVAEKLGFPVMMKPNSHLVVGFAERGKLLHDEADLKRDFHPYAIAPGQESLAEIYPHLRWPLLQRYLPSARNRVYSVSGIKDADGGVLSACVSFKREQWPPDVGVSTFQIGCEDARILERGLQIVSQVLSRGIFEIELLSDGTDLYPIDLNPRGFGFIELDIARGSDLPWLWFRSTLEPLMPVANQTIVVHLSARSSLLPIFSQLFRRRERDSATASNERRERSIPRAPVSMTGNWRDPLPMIVSHLHLLRHPRGFLRAQVAGWRG